MGIICRVSRQGKAISMARTMKEKVKDSFSSFILYFDEITAQKFARGAEISNKKSITGQQENRRWFKVGLVLFLAFPSGTRGDRSEGIGNPLIPGSTAMNALVANKNLRGLKLSERRQTLATETPINYHDFPRGNSPPNKPVRKQANSYKRDCNIGYRCRQGSKGKKN